VRATFQYAFAGTSNNSNGMSAHGGYNRFQIQDVLNKWMS
jgi:hypothetical protein